MSPIMMEVIEWFDQTGTGIVQRYPEGGSGDIKMGAQLIVRENQAAGDHGCDVHSPVGQETASFGLHGFGGCRIHNHSLPQTHKDCDTLGRWKTSKAT